MNERAKRTYVEQMAEGGRRAAKAADCPRCGAPILVGPDHDECAMTARVDAEPIDPAAEMVAILAGRPTYDLLRQRGKEARAGSLALHIRNREHYLSGRDYGGTVHAEHECETSSDSMPSMRPGLRAAETVVQPLLPGLPGDTEPTTQRRAKARNRGR